MTNRNPQSGVTLLLSIMILSAITLVTVAVSTFTVQEIRSSRATVFSEPAYNAAEAGTEVALWTVKRGDISTIPNCNGTATFNTLSNNSANSSVIELCRTYGAGTFDLTSSPDTVLFLYDPDDINGNVDLISYPYNSITVTNQSTSFAINVKVARIDNTDNPFLNFNVNPNTQVTENISAVGAGSEGRMMVTLSSPSGNATVQVDTNQGLPDILSIESSGCSAKTALTTCGGTGQETFTRKIEVKIPNAPTP